MGLEDYKDIVSTCATITTMGQMFSGTFICKDIYKKGTSKGVDPMPFVGGTAMCILMFRYALMMGDPAMINTNIIGLLINVAYLSIYYYYTQDRKPMHALMGKAVAFVMVFLSYAHLENPDKIEFRYGLIITALFFMLIAAPLIHLKEIIRTKNTDILPFPLILMGTLVSSQWLLYGIIINNYFLIFQNVVGFALSVGQLSLFVIFPSKPSTAKTSSQKED